VTVPLPTSVSGQTISAAVAVRQTTAGRYDKGYLIVSHDGAIVATAQLDTALTQSGGSTLAISGLPSAVDSSLYYVSVRVWNSSDPAGRLNRVTYPTALDLRTGGTTSYSVQID